MFSNSYLNIILSSSIVYIFIIVGLRIFGKKELAQLSVVDLVFVMLISNAVQNAMVGSDSSLLGGLVAAITLFSLNYLFKFFRFRSNKFAKLIEGEPVILVLHGKVKDAHLRRVEITIDELLEAIHEHGVSNIKEVNLAILEVDGNISILSEGYKKHSIRSISKNKSHLKKGSSSI